MPTAGRNAGRRLESLPHIRMPAPQEEAGPQRELAPQSGATRGRSHPPPRLAAWHARLRAPRRGRCGKPGGMLHDGRTRRSAPTREAMRQKGGRWREGRQGRLERLPHIRMPAPQEEAGPQRELAPQSGATRGRSHPPPRLAAWHARLRAPREHLVWHARLRAPRKLPVWQAWRLAPQQQAFAHGGQCIRVGRGAGWKTYATAGSLSRNYM